MTSITKHNYGRENKENQSNNKRNGLNPPNTGESGFDWAEREAISNQRKQRITEVRQQSKDIASQIRDNVRDASKRQLDKLNSIKQDELTNWRQKQTDKAERDYRAGLARVGEAHLMAEHENDIRRKVEEQKRRNHKLALRRGQLAHQQMKGKGTSKTAGAAAAKKDVVKEKRVVTIATTVADYDSDSSVSSSSSASSVCSVILVEDKSEKEKRKISKSPRKKSQTPSPKRSPRQPKHHSPPTRDYDPSRFDSMNSGTDVSTSSPLFEPRTITRISEMLGKKDKKTSRPLATIEKSPTLIKKTYKLTSPMKIAKSPMKKPILRTQTLPYTKPSGMKVMIKAKSPTKKNVKTPTKATTLERKHYVPEFVKKKPTATVTSGALADPSKVKFYDHANRFSKEYAGNIDLVEEVDKNAPSNAWQEAQKEISREQIYRRQIVDTKNLEEARAAQALEKEKIRKDYELMSGQLSEFMQNEELANKFLHANKVLSETRLQQIAEEKQKLMKEDFRSVLQVPPVVITCPKKKLPAQAYENGFDASDINVAGPTTSKNVFSQKQPSQPLSETDESAQSFLLDYVSAHSSDIADDIDRCRNDCNKSNQSKINALLELLTRVNSMARILCEQIKQNSSNEQIADQVYNEMEKVKELQNEIMNRKKVKTVSAPTTTKEKSSKVLQKKLSEREKILEIKELAIDEKARELYLREKKLKEQKSQVNTEKGQSKKKQPSTEKVPDEVPPGVKIKPYERPPEAKSSGETWSDRLRKSSFESTRKGSDERQGKVYPKTPVAKKPVAVRDSDSTSQLSTVTDYLSPPEHIDTNLSKELQKRQKPIEQNPLDFDPKLLPYIQRLLQMSRSSIEGLECSVSTVKTPSSSIINISSNRQISISSISSPISSQMLLVEEDQPPPIDENKIQQLVKFLTGNQMEDGNEPVLNIDMHKRKEKGRLGPLGDVLSMDEQKLRQLAKYIVENQKRMDENKKGDEEQKAKERKGTWHDILSKKRSTKKSTSKSENTETLTTIQRHPISSSNDSLEENQDLILKYDELTANCKKRIINLNSLISKVREEKQKLVENTLSSAGSLITGRDANLTDTAYLEYPAMMQQQQQQQQQQQNETADDGTFQLSDRLSDSKSTQAPSTDFSSTSNTAIESSAPVENATRVSLGNKIGLAAACNKPFAESKDSGVGNSRPVTSSDYRDSPDLKDLKVQGKQTEPDKASASLAQALREPKNDVPFEPLLKDIPKFGFRFGDGNENQQQEVESELVTSLNSRDKAAKPPAALTRHSPYMHDEVPHELSTITEVDTPVTSRLNATDSVRANDTLKSIREDDLMQLMYKKFPTFEEYAKANNVDVSGLSGLTSIDDKTANASRDFENSGDLLEASVPHFEAFKFRPLQSTNQREAGQPSQGIEVNLPAALDYQKFPPHSEYAQAESGLLDSQSIDRVELSDSSLPDISNELRKRNLITPSFGALSELLKNSQANQSKPIADQSTQNADLDALSESLAQELNSMGMSWATTVIKKSREANTTSTSSSSETLSRDKNILRPIHKSPRRSTSTKQSNEQQQSINLSRNHSADASNAAQNTTDFDGNAKSINLKEFLARELLKHSSMSSSSSTDSSLASIFLKSFLGGSNTSSTDKSQSQHINSGDKHRTSTPVNYKSTGSADSKNNTKRDSSSLNGNDNKNSKQGSSGDLSHKVFFQDESHLSSVRFSSESSEEERRKHADFEIRMIPAEMKLNLAGARKTHQ